MGDTTFDKKIKLLEAERKAILEPWMSAGSPTTIQSIHDRVQKDINWNPSWNTIKRDVEIFHEKGWVEIKKMPGGQTIVEPKGEKIKGWQKIDFEKILKKEKNESA